MEHSPEHRCTAALVRGTFSLTSPTLRHCSPLTGARGGARGDISLYLHIRWLLGQEKLVAGWLISSLALTSLSCSQGLFLFSVDVVFTPSRYLSLKTSSYYLCHAEAFNIALLCTVRSVMLSCATHTWICMYKLNGCTQRGHNCIWELLKWCLRETFA